MAAFQIRFKLDAGVIPRFHPKVREALVIVAESIHEITDGEVQAVVTSGWDGKHSQNSLHYCGCAVDIRSKTLESHEKRLVLQQFQTRMPDADEFDFILEYEGQPNEHFHLEWDEGKYDRHAAIRAAFDIDTEQSD